MPMGLKDGILPSFKICSIGQWGKVLVIVMGFVDTFKQNQQSIRMETLLQFMAKDNWASTYCGYHRFESVLPSSTSNYRTLSHKFTRKLEFVSCTFSIFLLSTTISLTFETNKHDSELEFLQI